MVQFYVWHCISATTSNTTTTQHERGAPCAAEHAGIDAAPKHAARCRLQLAEFAVLECVSHQQLIQLLPSLTQQVCFRGIGWQQDVNNSGCAAAAIGCGRACLHTHFLLPLLLAATTHMMWLLQANIVLAAHRQDAACINSLAALLTSCVAKLLHGALGSYAAMHGPQAGSVQAAAAELVTADYMCTALLHPVIKSTYR